MKKCKYCGTTKNLIKKYRKDFKIFYTINLCLKCKYKICSNCDTIITHESRNGLCERCRIKKDKLKNPQKYKEKYRKYRLNRTIEQQIRHKQHNKEYIQRNKKRLQEKRKLLLKNDIQYALSHSLRVLINKKIKQEFKINCSVELLGCNIQQLREHLEQQFKPGMNWNNHGVKGWHIDHIKPCFLFDLTDIKQQKICFHYTNLRPLWWYENLKRNCLNILLKKENNSWEEYMKTEEFKKDMKEDWCYKC